MLFVTFRFFFFVLLRWAGVFLRPLFLVSSLDFVARLYFRLFFFITSNRPLPCICVALERSKSEEFLACFSKHFEHVRDAAVIRLYSV